MQAEEKETIRAISGLFTTATLRALAAPEPWAALERLDGVEALMSSQSPLGAVLDQAYDVLLDVRRSEYVFKNTVVSRTVFGRHRPTTTSAAVEFQMGKSFADVAVFNGSITAYEIKTDLDSFTRLRSQLADYSSVAEKVYVVTSPRRASTALELSPAHVGVMVLTDRGQLSGYREASRHREALTHRALFRVLRSGERDDLLRMHGYSSAASTRDVFDTFRRIPIRSLYQDVTSLLKKRFSDAAMMAGGPTVPRSLRALICGTELSPSARMRVVARLSEPPSALLRSA